MATILEFKDARRNDVDAKDDAQSDSMTDSGETAQIIFFPGIRIERYDIDPFLEENEASAVQDRSSSSSV